MQMDVTIEGEGQKMSSEQENVLKKFQEYLH